MSISTIKSASGTVAESKLAALAAMVLGAGIIMFIGFSHVEAVHNAAHDTRHSSAFPCH